MSNPNPKIDQIKATQFPMVGDQPLSRRVIGIRFSQQMTAKLEEMGSSDRQAYIREAVEAKMRQDGLL